MTRNFGLAGGRQSPRGQSTPPAASIGSYAPSNSILLPATDTPLERLDISDTFRDIIAVGFAFLFVSSVGIGFAFTLFVALFVELH